jgi:tripartite-type tricarboxylate transporter receptor subunit TctC
MKLSRRKFLEFVGIATSVPTFSQIVAAQSYPAHPITMIVPFAAGGTTDVLGRLLAERMKVSLGQPVIIENISGADGSIGAGRAARARPDGYTIELGITSSNMLNGALYSLPYDVLNDFMPISPLVTSSPVLLARRALPAKDLKELIAWLKANPNKASAGIATSMVHLITRLLQKETGAQFALVPYRGVAPVIQDLVAGQIDLAFGALDALPLVRAGTIKAYAVLSSTRSTLAPDIPTFAELGLSSLSPSAWWALFAPKGTPQEIVERLNAAVVGALADPAVRLRLVDLGMEAFPRERQTPQALWALQKAEAEKWWPIIKAAGIKGE